MEKKITPKKKKVEVKPADAKKKNPTTNLYLFTIEGHETWRVLLAQNDVEFEKQTIKQPKFPKMTGRKVFIVDKITGTVKEK